VNPDRETPARTDAVLFDFGGVFIDSPFAAVGDAAERLGVETEVLTGLVFGRYDLDTGHPWHRLERGEVTFAQARAEITELAAATPVGPIDPIEVLASMASGGLELRQDMVAAVRRYREAGLRTGIVTNNIAEFGSTWRALLPLDELFDDVVDSSDVGLRKPDSRIYRLACERLQVDPSRTVFIDDHAGNVAGAVAAGLLGVCCGYTRQSTSDAIVELDRIVLGTQQG